MTPNDLGAVLSIRDRRTLERWADEVGLRRYRVGQSWRVRPEDFDAALAAAAVRPDTS